MFLHCPEIATTSTTDFVVTCITDADDDGKKATWTATKTTSPNLNTKKSIH